MARIPTHPQVRPLIPIASIIIDKDGVNLGQFVGLALYGDIEATPQGQMMALRVVAPEPPEVPTYMYSKHFDVICGGQNTNQDTFLRLGARQIDIRDLAPTRNGLALRARFTGVLESSVSGVTAEFRLFDTTAGVAVTGTTLDNDAAPDKTLPFEVSGDLTIGTAAGNLKNDGAFMYEVQLRMAAGSAEQVAICRNARVELYYA